MIYDVISMLRISFFQVFCVGVKNNEHMISKIGGRPGEGNRMVAVSAINVEIHDRILMV